MLDARQFTVAFTSRGIRFFTGVPDSLLKEFCAYVMRELPADQHIIAANEGGSVGLAIGHFLATGSPALVYMQNSGFGNAINPLLSLADPDVYGIPMLLLVGWRGKPGDKDEPQHVKQGRVMTQMIEAMELPWSILPKDQVAADACVAAALNTALERSTPFVLLVDKDTFAPAGSLSDHWNIDSPSREEALIALLDAVGSKAIFTATTGMLGRELYERRAAQCDTQARDFLTIGGMGHNCSVAAGIALQNPDKEVWCLDGDGSLLMHMGSMAVIAQAAPKNLFHVVFNNGVHDSVGGQPTAVRSIDVPSAAKAAGYLDAFSAGSRAEISRAVGTMHQRGGPILLDIKVKPGNRPGIGRPKETPVQAKQAFMQGDA